MINNNFEISKPSELNKLDNQTFQSLVTIGEKNTLTLSPELKDDLNQKIDARNYNEEWFDIIYQDLFFVTKILKTDKPKIETELGENAIILAPKSINSKQPVFKIFTIPEWREVVKKAQNQQKKDFLRLFCAHSGLTKMDEKGRIKIPKNISSEFGLEQGTKLKIVKNNKGIYIHKIIKD